ncbi:MAG: hypothetical protein ACTSU2_09175 [Promethearchaeota archaeon]
MQAPTHFLVGIFIYKLWLLIIPNKNSLLFIIPMLIFVFFSHYLVDAFAYLTYHVPDARPQDKFWLSYHIFIYSMTLFMVIFFWRPYWPALIASIFIDIIDWGILRPILHHKPVIHPSIDKFRKKCFPFLPNLLEKKWTVINEFVIWTILIILIFVFNL